MKMKLFAIYDSQTKLFELPVCSVNEFDYVRSISVLLEDKTTRFNKHYMDLSCYEVGSYDTETGIGEFLKEPHRICYMKELVKPERELTPQMLLEKLQEMLGNKR